MLCYVKWSLSALQAGSSNACCSHCAACPIASAPWSGAASFLCLAGCLWHGREHLCAPSETEKLLANMRAAGMLSTADAEGSDRSDDSDDDNASAVAPR